MAKNVLECSVGQKKETEICTFHSAVLERRDPPGRVAFGWRAPISTKVNLEEFAGTFDGPFPNSAA